MEKLGEAGISSHTDSDRTWKFRVVLAGSKVVMGETLPPGEHILELGVYILILILTLARLKDSHRGIFSGTKATLGTESY